MHDCYLYMFLVLDDTLLMCFLRKFQQAAMCALCINTGIIVQ